MRRVIVKPYITAQDCSYENTWAVTFERPGRSRTYYKVGWNLMSILADAICRWLDAGLPFEVRPYKYYYGIGWELRELTND